MKRVLCIFCALFSLCLKVQARGVVLSRSLGHKTTYNFIRTYIVHTIPPLHITQLNRNIFLFNSGPFRRINLRIVEIPSIAPLYLDGRMTESQMRASFQAAFENVLESSFINFVNLAE